MLSCISKAAASRLREVIFSLNAAPVRLNQEYCVQFGPPQCKKNHRTMEQVQQRICKISRVMDKERLNKLSLFSLKHVGLGEVLFLSVNT